MTRTIAIASGKGGVGKSNLGVNLAIALGRLGRRTCLFDADMGLANVDILMGLYPERRLEDVAAGRAAMSDVIIADRRGIDIVPGGSGVETLADLPGDEARTLVRSLAELGRYDELVFDTSSGIHAHVLSFCLCADETLVVLTPEPTSLVDAFALLKVLGKNGFRGTAKIVVNQCAGKEAALATYRRFKAVAVQRLPVKLAPLGLVVHDPLMEAAVAAQEPLIVSFPESPAARCIRLLAKRLMDEPGEPVDEDFSGFWARVFDRMSGPLTISGETPQAVPAAAPTPKATPSRPRPVRPPMFPPVHPRVLASLLEFLAKDEADGTRLAEWVGLDPGLAFRVMAAAGLMGAGRGRDVLRESVESLGPSGLRFLVSAAAAGLPPDAGVHDFLVHSLRGACLAGLIGERFARLPAGEAYLAGLVRDLGQTVWPRENGGPPPENTRPGHGRVGAGLIGRWDLPSFLADACLYHHESPDRIRDALPLARAVHLAEAVLGGASLTTDEYRMVYGFPGLTEEALAKLKVEAETLAGERAALAGIDLNRPYSEADVDADARRAVRSVLDAALLDGLAGRDGPPPTPIDRRLGLAVLFGIRHAAVFILSPGGDELSGMDGPGWVGTDGAGRLKLGLGLKNSLVVQAFLTGSRRHSAKTNGRLSLADEQLLRRLGEDVLYCQPMTTGGWTVGVLALGLDRDGPDRLESQAALLSGFAARAALAVPAIVKPTGPIEEGPACPNP